MAEHAQAQAPDTPADTQNTATGLPGAEEGAEEGAPDAAAPAPPASALRITLPDGAQLADAPTRLAAPARLGFDVRGKVKGFDYSAHAELLWQHDGARYQAQQRISAFLLGARTQTSQGALGTRGLVPERFDDQARRLRSATLDFAQQRAHFSRPDTPPAPIAEGAQDRLSVFLQLGALIAAAPGRYPEGTRITIDTVGPTDVAPWSFVVREAQALELPMGRVSTLRLERLPHGTRAQRGELWLDPDIGYLPARIRLSEDNGDFAELSLRSIEAP